MKKLLIILLCAALTACSSNNVNTPTFTQPSSTPTNAPATESTKTPILTPEKVVMEGSEVAMLGIPVGSMLETDANGNPTGYSFTNPNNNRTTEVAKIDKDGNIVKEEFLNHNLVSCTASEAEIRANVWDLDKVDGNGVKIGDANLLAMLKDKEAFSDEVLTGRTIEIYKAFLGKEQSIKEDTLIWDKETQKTFDANPEKMPHKIMGCFAVNTSTVVDGKTYNETYIGVVHKWKNSDGSFKFITTFHKDNAFFATDINSYVFPFRRSGEAKTSPYKFLAKILGDQVRSKILDQWVEDKAVPGEAEKTIFIGASNDYNHK